MSRHLLVVNSIFTMNKKVNYAIGASATSTDASCVFANVYAHFNNMYCKCRNRKSMRFLGV